MYISGVLHVYDSFKETRELLTLSALYDAIVFACFACYLQEPWKPSWVLAIGPRCGAPSTSTGWLPNDANYELFTCVTVYWFVWFFLLLYFHELCICVVILLCFVYIYYTCLWIDFYFISNLILLGVTYWQKILGETIWTNMGRNQWESWYLELSLRILDILNYL